MVLVEVASFVDNLQYLIFISGDSSILFLVALLRHSSILFLVALLRHSLQQAVPIFSCTAPAFLTAGSSNLQLHCSGIPYSRQFPSLVALLRHSLQQAVPIFSCTAPSFLTAGSSNLQLHCSVIPYSRQFQSLFCLWFQISDTYRATYKKRHFSDDINFSNQEIYKGCRALLLS